MTSFPVKPPNREFFKESTEKEQFLRTYNFLIVVWTILKFLDFKESTKRPALGPTIETSGNGP